MKSLKLIALAALCWSGIALPDSESGAQARVSIEGKIYRLHSEVIVALSPAQVRAVLTQYTMLPRVNSGISAVHELKPAADGALRLRVETSACVLKFCRLYRWVQAVHDLRDGSIRADIEPQDSDFRRGITRYRFEPHGDCTHLLFDAELEPKFWIPPLLGPWLMERKLITEAVETARSVEYHAGVKTASQCPPLPPD